MFLPIFFNTSSTASSNDIFSPQYQQFSGTVFSLFTVKRFGCHYVFAIR
jgi:hypothetical protein